MIESPSCNQSFRLNMQSTLNLENISDIVQLAIKEDIGKGDITSEIFIPKDSKSEGIFIANENGIVAGLPVAKYVLSQIDDNLVFTSNVEEGSRVSKGTAIANVKGSTQSILSAERLVLNFLQRLSGIATLTSKFVEKVKGYKTQIMDTRKTIPGSRSLERYAVRVGGGTNHRMGLYDQILVKDNHLKIIESEKENGTMNSLVKKARERIGRKMLIEVEVDDLSHVRDVLNAGVDIIMFDNMEPSKISEAIKTVKEYEKVRDTAMDKAILTEASGNITLENVESYAQTGVDRISVGMITHSAKVLDISLEIV
ncbi:MAG: carboxylating nicotinate-nucleotide diphosphorylase [Candidatus Scalindua sediminis]|nr:carboxylating nicotinate-nucleotide diphosphorylase [Candidatus Scalindua sediminis]